MKKTVLITGGAGFIGSQLARKLLLLKYRVIVVDNSRTGKIENLPEGTIFYQTDITNFAELQVIIEKEKPDIISHHAAQAQVRFSVSNPQEDAETNIIGLLNLLECIKDKPQIHFLLASSGGAIYDGSSHKPLTEEMPLRPLSQYGVSKLTSEAYLYMYEQLYHFKTTILRYGNVYGPYQSPTGKSGIVAMFIYKLAHDESVYIWGDGQHLRDYVYIDDVVIANTNAIQKTILGTFNIGTGVATTTLSIFELIAKELGLKAKPVFKPPQLGEQAYNCLDISKAARELHWQPQVDLKSGIQKTIEWQKSYLH